MPDPSNAIAEIIRLLRDELKVPISDVLAAYDQPQIPVSIYDSDLTPLQATVQYLSKKHATQEIATLLQRPIGTIQNAHKVIKKKSITLPTTETPYTLPIHIFSLPLTPAEAIVYYLSDHYNLPNKTIADLLGKDQRNTWAQLSSAKKKLGGSS